jgi:hypothetical protein|tara:strand:+ start:2961 stop:4781 length:1821 start_codon:yes stop_codon:yes gene_type:complete
MYHNKQISDKKLNNRIVFLTNNKTYFNRVYNLIITNLPRVKQYDKYYVINSDMAFFDHEMNVVIDTPYAIILKELVEAALSNDKVMTEIKSGEALLIFDFGNEIVPLSTNDDTMYGIINQHFKDLDCVTNVVYWTMYESPYDLIDKSECYVDIVSASLSTLRYIGFKYDVSAHLLHNHQVEPKSAIYLNRRVRDHRTKLLIECLRREIDLDDMHFSYIGTDKINSDENDISRNNDLSGILNTRVDDNQISESNFTKFVNDLYGKKLAMENKDTNEWLGSSNVGRVMELLNHRAKSKFEIITEYASTEDGVQISEKLSLAILSKIPFVVMGDKGYMNHLNELGFKTFDKFWSEDYDNCNVDGRVTRLASTILNIQKTFKCELDEYNNWVYNDEMNEILEHNYIHYKDVYAQVVANRILESVSKSYIDKPIDLIDKVWYNKYDNSIFIPIHGNEFTYFQTVMSHELGYKLMNRIDIVDIEKMTTYTAIRSPYERFKHQLYDTSLTANGMIKKYKDSECMKPQTYFLKGIKLDCVIDLDKIAQQITDPDGTQITETMEHMINLLKVKTEIYPIMIENMKLTVIEEGMVYDLFREDFKLYNKHKYVKDEI